MRDSNNNLINGWCIILLGFVPLTTAQLNAQATVPGLKVQLVSLTNASFALHNGALFPTFNPAFNSEIAAPEIQSTTFYRRLDSIIGFDNEHAFNFYHEFGYYGKNSTFNMGLRTQSHIYTKPDFYSPTGKSEAKSSSTIGYISFNRAIKISSILKIGGRLSYYYASINPQTFFYIKDYVENNHTLSLDAGILVQPHNRLDFGISVANFSIQDIDYPVFDITYFSGRIRGPVKTLNFDVLYRINSGLIFYFYAHNLLENDLKEPKLQSVIVDGAPYFKFDGYQPYPVNRSYFGVIRHRISGSFYSYVAAYRSSINILSSSFPREKATLETVTAYSTGIEFNHARLSVSLAYAFDTMKKQIGKFERLRFNQSFHPITISASWRI